MCCPAAREPREGFEATQPRLGAGAALVAGATWSPASRPRGPRSQAAVKAAVRAATTTPGDPRRNEGRRFLAWRGGVSTVSSRRWVLLILFAVLTVRAAAAVEESEPLAMV